MAGFRVVFNGDVVSEEDLATEEEAQVLCDLMIEERLKLHEKIHDRFMTRETLAKRIVVEPVPEPVAELESGVAHEELAQEEGAV